MRIMFISSESYPVFEVYDENKKIIHIKIDPETQGFRITCYDTKRVFFIENEVIKKTEITTLRNEYSQQLGVLSKSKSDINIGEIEIEGDQYRYKVTNDSVREITLSGLNSDQRFLNCKLDMGQFTLLHENYLSYLLFALAWFLFLAKEQAVALQFSEA